MYSKTFSTQDLTATDLIWQKTNKETTSKTAPKGITTPLSLQGMPKDALVTVNARTFPSDTTTIDNVRPGDLQLFTLRTTDSNADKPPLAMFLRPVTDTKQTVRYDAETHTLTVSVEEQSVEEHQEADVDHSNGSNVASFTGPAEDQWRNLSCCIDDYILATAGLETAKVVVPKDVRQTPAPDALSTGFVPLAVPALSQEGSSNNLQALQADPANELRTLIKCRSTGEWTRLIGEVQLSYLCFSYLGCLEGLYHWKRLLSCIPQADGLPEYEGLVPRLAQVLVMQFEMMDEEGIHMTIAKNDLKNSLTRFIAAGWRLPEVQQLARTINGVLYCNSQCSSDTEESN